MFIFADLMCFVWVKFPYLILTTEQEQLLVYNLSQSELLVAIPCGGGHRAWDFVLNNDPGSSETMQNRSQPLDGSSGQFVYIKRKDVVLCDVELSSRCNVLKVSGFTVNFVCIFPKHCR